MSGAIDPAAAGFVDTVALMRAAQMAYFRTRTGPDLAESKRLERLVDEQLRHMAGPRTDTPLLDMMGGAK